MTPTDPIRLDGRPVDRAFWPHLATQVGRWLTDQNVLVRDAVLLLPHSGLLAPARAAFAAVGGWQPRIETPATLAASMAPPAAPVPGMLGGDRTVDRLQAAALLRRHAFDASSAGRDLRAFEAAGDGVVATAQALHAASACQPPRARAAWWQRLRDALPPLAGPGSNERLLARVALEWAALAPPPATDLLRECRASAWVVLAAAGQDAHALLPDDGAPRLRLVAEPDPLRPFDAAALLAPPVCLRASTLEDEAAAATQGVLAALDAGAATVALVAQDRLVVRRIRALLDRAGIALDDETGWTLSTTRAASRTMAWLRASLPDAGRDACIEALRAEGRDARAIDALESSWRRRKDAPDFAVAVHARWRERVEGWRRAGSRPLAEWLSAWRDAAPALMDTLASDAAGRQVLDRLGLAGVRGAAWDSAAQSTRLDLAGFVAWVDDTLEAGIWRPAPAAEARVCIVPLTRMVLRPFDAVVFPGCDARRLGAWKAVPGLLPAPVAREFGVVEAERQRRDEADAFVHLLRTPRLTLLRRTHEAGEPLEISPLVERAWLARRRLGSKVPQEEPVALPQRSVERAPIMRPAPVMADALPPVLSATRVQALRDCPYRFFTQSALGLRAGDELDAALERKDQGTWLHLLLYRFHQRRAPGGDDHAALRAAADAAQAELGLSSAALWPFRAAFDDFAERYLEWLQAHEAAGWRFVEGEATRRVEPAALGGIALEGRLDRIDTGPQGQPMVIDYKSGSAEKLKQRVADPLEDTQLAFYAALLQGDTPPRAIYLALVRGDDTSAVYEHAGVAASAERLVDGLGQDLQALREGAPAPALGEGEACRFCEARGLCRRDHWPDAA